MAEDFFNFFDAMMEKYTLKSDNKRHYHRDLKNIAREEHSRHRSFDNFIVNILGAIAAYCMFPKKPCINFFSISVHFIGVFICFYTELHV